MVRIIEEEILVEETIEKHKIIVAKYRGIVILIGVEVGEEIDNVQIILSGMIEVVLGQDQVQEQILIEIE